MHPYKKTMMPDGIKKGTKYIHNGNVYKVTGASGYYIHLRNSEGAYSKVNRSEFKYFSEV